MKISLGSPVGDLARAIGEFYEGTPPELLAPGLGRPPGIGRHREGGERSSGLSRGRSKDSGRAASDSGRAASDSGRAASGRSSSGGTGGVSPHARPSGLSFPTFVERLSTDDFYLAFEPGSHAHEILANDQNRFSPPRALPPVLEVIAPDEEENPTQDYLIVRHAYSDGAFHLLEDLLSGGFEFSMHQYLDFTWQMAQALTFLHGHGIVHGQWNARSLCAIPQDSRRRPSLVEASPYRFEIFNSGVCFRHGGAIPREYVERGYYPHDVFLGSTGVPDYHAIDCESDVYCFAAFLKDVSQRSCSTEELPTQAARLLEDLQKEANPRGWKAPPEKLRAKELEILDHLYTIRLGTESIIQDGLRDREQRPSAADLLSRSTDLHEKSTQYLKLLRESGFEPVNVFGDELQHYTAFKLEVTPGRINNHRDSTVLLTGSGLPHDLIRVTLNERHRGVHVIEARPGRVEFQVSRGFPIGSYKVSINNRRTNGLLEVFAPSWISLEPDRAPLPWAGFDNLRLALTAERAPDDALYSLRRVNEAGDSVEGEIELAPPRPIEARSGQETVTPTTSPPSGAQLEREASPDESSATEATALPDEPASKNNREISTSHDRSPVRLELEVPSEIDPALYELFANGISTGLRVDISDPLPDPRVDTDALEYAQIKNYRAWSVRLAGNYFHPQMKIDLGDSTPSGFRATVESSEEAVLHVPAGFPPGEYTIRVNYVETPASFDVLEPVWSGLNPSRLKFDRRQEVPVAIEVRGRALPPPTSDSAQSSYTVWNRRGEVQGVVEGVEELRPEEGHRLVLSPSLPRGRFELRFGEANTGLAIEAKRPLPRVVYAGAALLSLVLLTGIGFFLKETYTPIVDSLAPAQVFSGLPSDLSVAGRYVDRVVLVSPDGSEERFELAREPDGDGYRLSLPALDPGDYQFRPEGPLFSGSVSTERLRVVAPELTLTPSEMHRHLDQQFVLQSNAGFPVETLEQVRFEPIGTAGDPRVVSLTRPETNPSVEIDGPSLTPRLDVLAGQWSAESEGDYRVVIDGIAVSSPPIVVRGATISEVQPSTLTLDSRGDVVLTVTGENLLSDLELGLRPIGASEFAFAFSYDGAKNYSGRATPGVYELGWVRDGSWLEALPVTQLTLLPPPNIDDVAPLRFDPGRPGALTFTGVNLANLDGIVLQPTRAGGVPVRIDVESADVKLLDGGRSSLRVDGVTFESGSYRVEPATEAFVVEVFDDCIKQLEAFKASGEDAESLVRCLSEERPPVEIRMGAANLLFDRGHFAAARSIYQEFDDVRSKFRAALITTALDGESAPLISLSDDQRSQPYAQGAIRLGFAVGEPAPIGWSGALPWDLEFVVGWTTEDPAEAVAALRRAIGTRRQAAGEHSISRFEPAWQALAESTLAQALVTLNEGRGFEAAELIRDDLVGDPELWNRLSVGNQAAAHFWRGHVGLWYAGDQPLARSAWTQAVEAGSLDPNGPNEWVAASREYLAATAPASLGAIGEAAPRGDTPGSDGTGGDARGRAATGWIGTFLDVYRFYREISEGPNFNLLTERYDFEVYLPPDEREKSVAFHRALRQLEAISDPIDPLAHSALLYYLRSAQRLSWPAQEGGAKAEQHRQKLLSLAIDGSNAPVRAYYVTFGEIAPLDSSQISVLPAAFMAEQTDRLNELKKQALPKPLEKSLETLRQKLTGGSSQ